MFSWFDFGFLLKMLEKARFTLPKLHSNCPSLPVYTHVAIFGETSNAREALERHFLGGSQIHHFKKS